MTGSIRIIKTNYLMMIVKIIKIVAGVIVKAADYSIFLIVFLFCFIGLLFAIPWILKQRRVWETSAKGNQKALILRGITLEKVMNRGLDFLLPYRNPSLKWIAFLDGASARETSIKMADNLCLIAWRKPKLARIMEKTGFVSTSILVRELVAVLKITSYCVKQRIGVLRAYKHNYPALQAYMVSRFIKIPFIVDIAGNYELVRRLTGKSFYFKKLNKVPIVSIFARIAQNWLLGLPLRKAFHVFGRNKNNYEHAFALGAPVERLSLLRYVNFSAAFNSYNPEQAPAKPAEYPYILFVGRLAAIKYPFDVLDAFNIAAPQLLEYRLVIIGDGPIRHDFEEKKERSEYKDRIVIMGACSSEIVLRWTAHARVALCPYSGTTLVEAMLCGIPVIAYDIEWHSDIVIDDYTGFLVPFADVVALAQKLIYVVSNYEEAKIVGARGRELARVAFDKEKILAKESMYYMKAFEQ